VATSTTLKPREVVGFDVTDNLRAETLGRSKEMLSKRHKELQGIPLGTFCILRAPHSWRIRKSGSRFFNDFIVSKLHISRIIVCSIFTFHTIRLTILSGSLSRLVLRSITRHISWCLT
jgi:hypothetical protein